MFYTHSKLVLEMSLETASYLGIDHSFKNFIYKYALEHVVLAKNFQTFLPNTHLLHRLSRILVGTKPGQLEPKHEMVYIYSPVAPV